MKPCNLQQSQPGKSKNLGFWWLYWAAESTKSGTTYLCTHRRSFISYCWSHFAQGNLVKYSFYVEHLSFPLKIIFPSHSMLLTYSVCKKTVLTLTFRLTLAMPANSSPVALFQSTITPSTPPKIFLLLHCWVDTVFTQHLSTLWVSTWDVKRK